MDSIDKEFTDGFNHVRDLFLADRLVECEKAAFALLKNGAIPRYHRMKTLIVLGTIVGDWEEACRYHVAAEAMWRIVRRYHRAKDEGNEEIEKRIAELREELDELDAVLRDDAPSEYDLSAIVEDVSEEHDDDVEDACAEMDDLELDDAPAAAATLPSINVEAPTDERQSPAKKESENLKYLTLSVDDIRDSTRQAPPDSPAMTSSTGALRMHLAPQPSRAPTGENDSQISEIRHKGE